jgi:glucokinase
MEHIAEVRRQEDRDTLDGAGPTVLVLDVGASWIKGALVGADGRRTSELRRPTGREAGPDLVLEHVAGLAEELATREGLAALAAAGVAVCGAVDQAGRVTAVNLGWSGAHIRSFFEQRLGIPVAVVNDAHAGAVGEGLFGAARDSADYLYVSLGTGIGAAFVQAGRVVTGAHGQAGELGHVRVDPNGTRCACGARGCLQTKVSAVALETRWAELYGEWITAREILDQVMSDEPRAGPVWLESVQALAAGLMTVMTLVDPATIVIGGGLAHAGDKLLAPLRQEIQTQTRPFHAGADLRLAALDDWSACAGAATIARQLAH